MTKKENSNDRERREVQEKGQEKCKERGSAAKVSNRPSAVRLTEDKCW
jgi:hypothetical protein